MGARDIRADAVHGGGCGHARRVQSASPGCIERREHQVHVGHLEGWFGVERETLIYACGECITKPHKHIRMLALGSISLSV